MTPTPRRGAGTRIVIATGRGIVSLSPREREIVRLVGNGLSNKQIGAVLDISPWTVSSHLRRLFAKCSVNSRAALVAAVLASER